MKERLSFDELLAKFDEEERRYLNDDNVVKLDGFLGAEFGCRVWKTHIEGWYLTDFDNRYYDFPDIYKEPNLAKKTGHMALFQDVANLGNARMISVGILKYKNHATVYIDKLLGK